ncbi:hypothetical protein [uncultured Methanocorpusculum sp.]|nr:hypothetical protein [uncultured Methanocorpusculum sp.]
MAAKKENKPEYAQLSLKIDKKLSDEVEKYWRLHLYQDKTSFVREALDFYIHAAKCERCGAVNPAGATHCAICHAPIGAYSMLFSRVKCLYDDIETERIARLRTQYYRVRKLNLDVRKYLYDIYKNDKTREVDLLTSAFNYMNAQLLGINDIINPLELNLLHAETDEEMNCFIEEERKIRDDNDYVISENHIFWKLHEAYLKINGVIGEITYGKWCYISYTELTETLNDLVYCSQMLKNTMDSLIELELFYSNILIQISN